MIVCKNCAVELEDDIDICPLCNARVTDGRPADGDGPGTIDRLEPRRNTLQYTLWQIACVLLMSVVLATLAVNVSIAGKVSWSIYPVTICLIILSYSAVMTIRRLDRILQLIMAWIISGVLLFVLQLFVSEKWPMEVVFPILSVTNIISILLVTIIAKLKNKGLNILVILLIAVAIYCLALDAVLSMYRQGELRLSWSVVVAACSLPVIVTGVFMHLRMRKNEELKKIFHL